MTTDTDSWLNVSILLLQHAGNANMYCPQRWNKEFQQCELQISHSCKGSACLLQTVLQE
jgi:hypothetical protein